MDLDRLDGNWKLFAGKIRERWGEMTDDDLEQLYGKRVQLEGLLQQRYGLSAEEAKRQAEEFQSPQ